MRYELETLEKLVLTNLNPTALQGNESIDLLTNEYAIVLRNEKERLRLALINACFKCKQEHVFKLYVQQHQRDLIRLANTVSGYLAASPSTLANTYLKSIECIDFLLRFMQENFIGYFDLQATMPIYLHQQTIAATKKQFNSIKKHLKQLLVDNKLEGFIINAFEDYMLPLSNHATYHRHTYLQVLGTELLRVNSHDELIQILYRHNFNSARFFSYFISSIQSAITTNDSLLAKQKISLFLKENNQRSLLPNTSLYANDASIKEMIQEWLHEEISFLDQQSNEGETQNKIPVAKFKKLPLNLSVNELAYFLLLFEQSNMLTVEVKKTLFKTVAAFCSTKKQAEISWHSLERKNTNVNSYTKNSVKDMLIKMLNIVNRKE